MKWNEVLISGYLARNTFAGHLVLIPNCTFTHAEVDLLVVHKNLKLIDVEVKISRADLKADLKKDKWWQSGYYPWHLHGTPAPEPKRVELPRGVWKHYYAMPEEIWDDKLIEFMPAASGILLLSAHPQGGWTEEDSCTWRVRCRRPAKTSKDAKPISAESAIYLGRLASLRMWQAFDRADKYYRELYALRNVTNLAAAS